MIFLPDGAIGFDEKVLIETPWQTVLKYLQCHEKNDKDYMLATGQFTDPLEALNLLIKYVACSCYNCSCY